MSWESASYWCYRCTRFVRVSAEDNSILCPYCDSGFVEAVDAAPSSDARRRFPAAEMYMTGNDVADPGRTTNVRFRRGRRNNSDRSPFNPVIVLRGPAAGGGEEGGSGDHAERNFELYYDDGAGSGLRPLPEPMSEFLMGSRLDRLLDQLTQIEINGLGRSEQPPASKPPSNPYQRSRSSTATSAPTRNVQCAMKNSFSDPKLEKCLVSTSTIPIVFSLGSPFEIRARFAAMNCQLIQIIHLKSTTGTNHQVMRLLDLLFGDCLAVDLRWGGFPGEGGAEEERELPVVYTEMDGGFNNNGGGAPRRIQWGSRSSRVREGGVGRAFRSLFSFIGRSRPSSNSNSSSSSSEARGNSMSRSRSLSNSTSMFTRYVRRRRGRGWIWED